MRILALLLCAIGLLASSPCAWAQNGTPDVPIVPGPHSAVPAPTDPGTSIAGAAQLLSWCSFVLHPIAGQILPVNRVGSWVSAVHTAALREPRAWTVRTPGGARGRFTR